MQDPQARALGAIGEELDAIGDELSGLRGTLQGIAENQREDGKVLREIQRALGVLSDAIAEVPALRRRVMDLERVAHLDAE